MKPPAFIECSVCGREFGSKSIVIHERQCLQKLRRTEITEESELGSGSKQGRKRDKKKSEKSDNTSPVKQNLLPKIYQEQTYPNKTPELRRSKLRPLTATLSKPKILNLEMKQFDMTLTRIDYSTSQLIISDEAENHKRSITLPSVYPQIQPSMVREASPTNQKQKTSNQYSTLKLPQSSLTTISSILGETEPYKKFVVKSDAALPQTRESVIKTPFLHTMSSLIQKSVSFALFPILSSLRPASLITRRNSTESFPQMQIIRRTNPSENILTSTNVSEVPTNTVSTGEYPNESSVKEIANNYYRDQSKSDRRAKDEKKEALEAKGTLELFNEEFFIGYPETLLLESDHNLKMNESQLNENTITSLDTSRNYDLRNCVEEIPSTKEGCNSESGLNSTFTTSQNHVEKKVLEEDTNKAGIGDTNIEITPVASVDFDETASLRSYVLNERKANIYKESQELMEQVMSSGSDRDEETDQSGYGIIHLPTRRRRTYKQYRTRKSFKRRKNFAQTECFSSNITDNKRESEHWVKPEIQTDESPDDLKTLNPDSNDLDSSDQIVSGIISAFVKIEEHNKVRTYKFIDQLKIVQHLHQEGELRADKELDEVEESPMPKEDIYDARRLINSFSSSSNKVKLRTNHTDNKAQYIKTNPVPSKCDKSMQFPEKRTASIQNSPLFHKRHFANTPKVNDQINFVKEHEKNVSPCKILQHPYSKPESFKLSSHDVYQFQSNKLAHSQLFPQEYSNQYRLICNAEKELHRVIQNWEEFAAKESNGNLSENSDPLLTKFYTLLIPKLQNSAATTQMCIIFQNKEFESNLAARKYGPHVTYLIIEQKELDSSVSELENNNSKSSITTTSISELTKNDYTDSDSTIVPSPISKEIHSKSEIETQTPRCLYEQDDDKDHEPIKHFYTINGIRYKSIFRVNTSPSFFRL